MSRTKASFVMIMVTAVTVTTLFLLPFTPRLAVCTVVAQQGDLVRTLVLEGMVRYRQEQTCLSLFQGVVNGVYVQAGQAVHRGDLLFSLDTEQQEAQLESLTKARYAQSSQGMEWLAAWQQNGSGLSAEQMLRQQIEAGKIRASADGRVTAVYVQTGDTVATASLLGIVSGREKCVVASARAQEIQGVQPGDAAALSVKGGSVAAVLSAIGAPETNEATAQISQRLTFVPGNGEWSCSVGEKATVELLLERKENVTLVPLGAVDGKNQVWVVENGQATPHLIDPSLRNEAYVACGSELAGKRLILQPDQYALGQGCSVKEAKRR